MLLVQKESIKIAEFVRIIASALYSLGYKKSGAYLEEESGISLHSSLVGDFVQRILDGKWDESVAALHGMGLADDNVVKTVSFLILEQKFLELLRRENVMDALKTLRTEIASLCIDNGRVRELSSQCVLNAPFGQDTVTVKDRSKLLEEVQKLLPSSVMIPERRLEHLVEQALHLQKEACLFHNSPDKEMSLYTDHRCGRDKIPARTLQALPRQRRRSSSDYGCTAEEFTEFQTELAKVKHQIAEANRWAEQYRMMMRFLYDQMKLVNPNLPAFDPDMFRDPGSSS